MTARRNVGTGGQSRLTLMVGALTSVFVLSHAFRTTITMASDPLVQELGTSTQVLGAIAGSFHIAFALAQPAVGIALDRYGPRLTILVGFLLTIAGSLVSAAAPNSTVLIAGQWLIGFGCSPALLAVMVFISQRYASERFAVLSGVVLSVGGTGMLMTGTPLAWTIEVGGWRMGFYGLAALSAVSWFSVFVLVDGKSAHKSDTPHQTLGEALRGLGSIFKMPHTYGICCLAATGYAAFLTLRGLWLGPLLVERHDFSLIEIGHVALAMSLAGIVGPLAFGKLDPGDKSRRNLLTVCSAIYTLTFAIHALGPPASLEIAMIVFNGFFGGYLALQYADVRAAYPTEMLGRAMSVFTMAMFAGVAAVQWMSGIAAEAAPQLGMEPIRAALLCVTALLTAGTLAFWMLPRPARSIAEHKTEPKHPTPERYS